jgi:hypothetical protein
VSTEAIPESVAPLLWDVDASTIELERDRALIFERVMSRGSWAAMRWLRGRYAKPALADFVRGEGRRKLAPRALAYWALVCDVELPSSPGGGRPSWASNASPTTAGLAGEGRRSLKDAWALRVKAL